ncbi:tRNA (5-methylaminomethyl-2-thiouridine)(34)-methyltransferase MnmD [Desulfurobacterium atlanticum]|uniref:tRNA U34 5-methylaminomethyl-2-thiouridine-forming methyltransferase MnmC n=1 Tax=Desulfurobacterium atlanticum TaxID=240169 RepID=A0A238XS47_9BACT|nr:MnmC family methyltransferase [Desulfurobacterium atlanticum]SNR61331.1 tRNA U34 5-methylaminomethyl-2-thiouridine-forming methyltransferase MnmC [Desulfurobacterium atlanticum]
MIKEILTQDGSPTFFSEEFGEPFHSISAGAFREAEEKFIKTTKIVEIAKKREVKVFDVCFGLGFNSLLAIHRVKTCRGKISILSFEKDLNVIKKSISTNWQELNYLKPTFKELLRNRKYENIFLTLNYTDSSIKIKLFIGEGREILKSIYRHYGETFDAVFHDPFSPKVNPELWSYDFFKLIAKMVRKGGILATYSCAGHIRKALHMAGFGVKEGVAIGRKSKSTIGIKGEATQEKLIKKFIEITTTTPYRDPQLKDPPSLIKSRREGCIHILNTTLPLEVIY